jgi:hypothetical protein
MKTFILNKIEQDIVFTQAHQISKEDPTTSMFGSPDTLPPDEKSPGYTGADNEAERMEHCQKGM